MCDGLHGADRDCLLRGGWQDKLWGRCRHEIEVAASGNIIKNVKSVIVPNTGGLRGIEAAAAIGALAGDAEAGLQVVSHVTPERDCGAARAIWSRRRFLISAAESEYPAGY